jgi:hypothetical protein
VHLSPRCVCACVFVFVTSVPGRAASAPHATEGDPRDHCVRRRHIVVRVVESATCRRASGAPGRPSTHRLDQRHHRIDSPDLASSPQRGHGPDRRWRRRERRRSRQRACAPSGSHYSAGHAASQDRAAVLQSFVDASGTDVGDRGAVGRSAGAQCGVHREGEGGGESGDGGAGVSSPRGLYFCVFPLFSRPASGGAGVPMSFTFFVPR